MKKIFLLIFLVVGVSIFGLVYFKSELFLKTKKYPVGFKTNFGSVVETKGVVGRYLNGEYENEYEFSIENEEGFPVADMSGQGKRVTKIPIVLTRSMFTEDLSRYLNKKVVVRGVFSYFSELPVFLLMEAD